MLDAPGPAARGPRSGEQLSALDATFLELEEADQSAHMHIGGVILLEPQPGGGAPPIEQIREDVMARLPDLPATRSGSRRRNRRLHWPSWERDPDFRVERHVRSAGLPAPAGSPSCSSGPASTTRSGSIEPSRSGRWRSSSSRTGAGRSSPRRTTA